MADRQDRATAYASMEEWEKRCNDYSGETVYDLANEVLRLRASLNDAIIDFQDAYVLKCKADDEIERLRAEVERLRAAGDALAHAMTQVASDEDWSAALRGWEARRER